MTDICLLGTGGMLPLKDRFLTGLYAEFDGKAILIDCGEGMQVAFAQHGLKISKVDMLLITHAHADHITGLPGLLLSIGNCARTEPLEIYMPESCYTAVQSLISVCGRLPYETILNVLPDDFPTSFEADIINPLLTVKTLPLNHSTPCIGYSLNLEKKPVFEPEKAKMLGVPVMFWKKLHSGESVTLDDGRTITTEDVTSEKRPPVKITYTTDTLPIEDIRYFAENSDLFICEGMYGTADKKQSMNEKGHMLMQDACEIAREANVGRLWLTHYSPAEKNPELYEEELKKIFPEVVISADGQRTEL